jgi:MFS transporter, DHA3 family, macrolide efflux protein
MRRILDAVTRSGPGLLFRVRGFALLWVGETVSQVGDGLNRVALLWFVYQVNHSALKTSVVGVLQTVPALVLSPLIGVYLDRLSKKRTLIVVSVVHGVLVAAIPLLHALGLLTLFRLYALVLVTSIVATFYGPTLMLAVPLIVGSGELRAANALIQSTGTIGVLLGPVVAGLAIAAFGTANVLYLDAATFFFFVACMTFVKVRERPIEGPPPLGLTPVIRDLREGLQFMIDKQPGTLLLTLVSCLQNFGASAFLFLLPSLAKQNVAARALSIGGVWSAFGAGMLLATLLIASLRDDPRRALMWFVPAALATGGTAVVSLTAARGRLTAGALMIVIGFAAASLTPVVVTLLQERTPENLRGRVLSTFNTANMAMSMVGMLAFGWAADHFGETPTLIAVGMVLIGSGIALRLMSWTGRARQLVMDPAAAAVATADEDPASAR